MPSVFAQILLIALVSIQVSGAFLIYRIFVTAKSRGVDLSKTMFYPILIAGVIYTLSVITEFFEGFVPMTEEIHTTLMLAVALVMLAGFYYYYNMIEKLPALEKNNGGG